jgi:MbtH protein
MAAPTEAATHLVVVNDEGQYSVWPAGRTRPEGWHEGGFTGGYDDCLDFIERTWVDMRPLSAR